VCCTLRCSAASSSSLSSSPPPAPFPSHLLTIAFRLVLFFFFFSFCVSFFFFPPTFLFLFSSSCFFVCGFLFCFCEEPLSLLYPHTREIEVPRYVVARYLVTQQQHARALTTLSCCRIHSFSHIWLLIYLFRLLVCSLLLDL